MQKPIILNSKSVVKSRPFHIEELELEFSNGACRIYERINPERPQAVMIVAIDAQDRLLLVREYGAGLDDYYLSLPKGALEHSELAITAGNRELMEEAGFGSNKITILSTLSLSPSYLGNEIIILLAEELYPKRLPGDEPEELEVV